MVIFAIFAAIVAMVAIATMPPLQANSVAAIVVLIIGVCLSRNLWAPLHLSPVIIVVGGLVLIGTLGAQLYAGLTHVRGASALQPVLSANETMATQRLFLLAAAFVS